MEQSKHVSSANGSGSGWLSNFDNRQVFGGSGGGRQVDVFSPIPFDSNKRVGLSTSSVFSYLIPFLRRAVDREVNTDHGDYPPKMSYFHSFLYLR
jgi:hypothetical protein